MRFLLLISATFALGACSIYSNDGRKQFEQRIQGTKIKTEVGTAAHKVELARADFSGCWVQKRNEEIWSVRDGLKVETYDLNDTQMAVCLVNEETE